MSFLIFQSLSLLLFKSTVGLTYLIKTFRNNLNYLKKISLKIIFFILIILLFLICIFLLLTLVLVPLWLAMLILILKIYHF